MPEIKIKPPWADLGDGSAGDGGKPGTGPLLEPEYAAPYRAYARSPTPENADALLSAVRPVLSEAVRSYAGGEAGSPTTTARAKSLALEAFSRYDPDRAKLRTHLLSHLRGLRRQTARSASPVYVPEGWRANAVRMSAALPDLEDRLGREPSDAELADHMGIGLDQVRRARSVPGVLASGQMADAQPSGPVVDPEAWKTWTEAVYLDSTPVDQVILDHGFGLHGKPVLTGGQIAKKLNISPGAVSQRKAKLQQQLNEYHTFLGQPQV